MPEHQPSKTEILNLVNAQSATVDELSKRVAKIEQNTERQEDRNKNIVVAVLIAAVLVVAAVAVQVLVSDHRDGQRADNLLERVHNIEVSNVNLKMETAARIQDFKNCIWKNGLVNCLE